MLGGYYWLVWVLCSALGDSIPCSSTERGYKCVGKGINSEELGLDLQKLDYKFEGNHVSKIDGDSFKKLPNLQFLWLQSNAISDVDETTFNFNVDLTRLDLSFNLIVSLPPLLFRNTANLREFYCHDNNLTSIDKNLFRGLSRLADVRLQNNQLSRIDPTSFQTNRLLFELYLENNLLETAHWRWISHFNHTSSGSYELYLDNNPWSCDCRMSAFRDALLAHKWTAAPSSNRRFSIPRCQHLDGKPKVIDVRSEEFTCIAPVVTSQNNCSDPCSLLIKEGSAATLDCSGSGKPSPKSQLLDARGKPITNLTPGGVLKTFDHVTSEDAGIYVCVVTGVDADRNAATIRSTINVTVVPTSSPAGAILGACLAILVVAGAVALYLYRYKRNSGYDSLSNENDERVHYDVNDEDYAKEPDDTASLHKDHYDVTKNYCGDSYAIEKDTEVLV